MKIGLIARSEIARGIAIQSRNFYDHMPVERVLLVRMPRPDCEERPEWYADRTDAAYDMKLHQLDERLVREWLDGLDVVFTVETPNDWRMPLWCRQMGVKLIIQGNPEFVRHRHPDGEHLPHPDEWWWPTRWRVAELPRGRVMPVPMDRRATVPPVDDRLRLVHVVGKRAWADRNGTDLLVQIIPMLRHQAKLTIYTIDPGLPQFTRRRHIEYDFHEKPVEDLWSMYLGHHVLLLPRRYGGLCLPAVEAGASGLVVAMPDCVPNQDLASILLPGATRRKINLACGPVGSFDCQPQESAWQLDRLARDVENGDFHRHRLAQSALLPTWDEWRPKYLTAMEELCAST